MRSILVPTAARPECAVALDVAFRLAGELAANVAACHVRPERRERFSRPSSVAAATESSTVTSAAAHDLLTQAAERYNFSLARRPAIGKRRRAIWHDMVGTPERILGVVGPIADLLVVSRPKPRSAGRARAFLLAALLHTARPVLIVPQKPLRAAPGKNVVIAWNQSADAALAVAAALPLLQRAERVIVVTGGAESRAGPKASYLGQYLANWDVKIERVRTKGRDVERELEAACRDTAADLLVMGAYSRHWFRERVFGGVTEYMAFKTDLPVLMLHR
jgi:nucleotide-binding universal stress UspA family protein